jgi:hypothetical protein
MSKAFEEIAREATLLSRDQRNRLASLLLDLNEESDDPDLSLMWEKEVLARIQAVDEGEAKGISFDTVMRDAEARLS